MSDISRQNVAKVLALIWNRFVKLVQNNCKKLTKPPHFSDSTDGDKVKLPSCSSSDGDFKQIHFPFKQTHNNIGRFDSALFSRLAACLCAVPKSFEHFSGKENRRRPIDREMNVRYTQERSIAYGDGRRRRKNPPLTCLWALAQVGAAWVPVSRSGEPCAHKISVHLPLLLLFLDARVAFDVAE